LKTNIKGIPSEGLVGKNFQPEKKREFLCTGTTNIIVSVNKLKGIPWRVKSKVFHPKI